VRVWLGLKNSDDQGTSFDVVAQVYKNGDVIGEGLLRCVKGVTRNPIKASEITIVPALDAPQTFDGTADTLTVRLRARIGTTPDGKSCGGHGSASGLRAYFDAVGQAARLDARVEER